MRIFCHKKTLFFPHVYEVPRVVKSAEMERIKWFPGTGEGGNAELLFNGYRASILQDEESSGDWLCSMKIQETKRSLKLKDLFSHTQL